MSGDSFIGYACNSKGKSKEKKTRLILNKYVNV